MLVMMLRSAGFAVPPDVNIGIGGQGGGKIVIAVSRFFPDDPKKTEEIGASDITSILRNDLFMNGAFSLRDGPELSEENAELNFIELIKQGNEYLCTASYSTKKGEITLTGALFSVKNTYRLFKKKFKGPADEHRNIVHQFSEEIIRLLLGTGGLTDSKITFVSKKSTLYFARPCKSMDGSSAISPSATLSASASLLFVLVFRSVKARSCSARGTPFNSKLIFFTIFWR